MNAPFDPDKFMITKAQEDLRHFVPAHQLRNLITMAKESEERHFFITRMVELAALVTSMPQTYAQDGLGDSAIVHLHYFAASCDWWITERDSSAEQHQAFGLASLNGCNPELGYISIAELCEIRQVELDIHWQPCTIGHIKKGRPRAF